MDDRVYQFRVGVVVIATLLITGLLVALISDPQSLTLRGRYPILIQLRQAPGVAEGTPVLKNGVLIGRVASVQLADEGVEVTARIDANRKLRESEIARVRTSLLGDAVIEFVPGPVPSDEMLRAGQAIEGVVRADPIEMLLGMREDIQMSITSVGEAGTEVATLARRVNTLLEEADTEQLQTLIARTDAALVAFTQTMDNINSILGDPELQANLRTGIEQIPTLFADARDTMDQVQEAVRSAENNLRNLEGLTGPLGDQGDEIVSSLESATGNLDAVLGQVAQFSKSINNEDGTVGKLLRSPELYNEVLGVVKQIDTLVRSLRAIREDIRAFTNRLARRGLGGAIHGPGFN